MPNETSLNSWFEVCSLNSKMAYVIACAIADRAESARWWTKQYEESGSASALALAEDAVRCHAIMKEIQESMAKGEIVTTRIMDTVTACPDDCTCKGTDAHTLPYNGDPADGTAPSHRDW